MSQVNLMKRVKLRGAGRKRARGRKASPKVAAILLDKRNPYSTFLEYSPEELYAGMADYVQTLNPQVDIEKIRVMNLLMTKVPWSLVRPFFIRLNNSPGHNLVEMFDQYFEEIKDRVAQSTDYIKSRRATPLGPPPVHRPKPPPAARELIRLGEQQERKPVKQTYFGAEIPDKCVSEYQRAPWMLNKFSKRPIRGIVMRKSDWTTDQEPQPGWFKVKASWYPHICKNGREFVENNLGYLTDEGKIIVETKAMYKASRGKEADIDIGEEPATERSFKAAEAMLRGNDVPDEYVSSILEALPDYNNNEMAKSLADFLVYMSPLTKEPQIFIKRVKNGLYIPAKLLRLTKREKLPEIYKNPLANQDQMDNIIKSKKKRLVGDFIYRVGAELGPGIRVRGLPVKPEVFPHPEANSAKCPPAINNIYYREGGTMYCFDLEAVRNEVKNPISGKKFSRDFIREMKGMRTPAVAREAVAATSAKEEIPELREPIGNKRVAHAELAPGLFEKLKEEILLLDPIYCSQCNIEVMVPQFKSVKGSELVQFCTSACFEKFEFGAKRR